MTYKFFLILLLGYITTFLNSKPGFCSTNHNEVDWAILERACVKHMFGIHWPCFLHRKITVDKAKELAKEALLSEEKIFKFRIERLINFGYVGAARQIPQLCQQDKKAYETNDEPRVSSDHLDYIRYRTSHIKTMIKNLEDYIPIYIKARLEDLINTQQFGNAQHLIEQAQGFYPDAVKWDNELRNLVISQIEQLACKCILLKSLKENDMADEENARAIIIIQSFPISHPLRNQLQNKLDDFYTNFSLKVLDKNEMLVEQEIASCLFEHEKVNV